MTAIVNRRVGVRGGQPMEQPHWVIRGVCNEGGPVGLLPFFLGSVSLTSGTA